MKNENWMVDGLWIVGACGLLAAGACIAMVVFAIYKAVHNQHFSTEGQQVYDEYHRLIVGADAKTFKLAHQTEAGEAGSWDFYFTDKDHVFYEADSPDPVVLLPDADPATFVVLAEDWDFGNDNRNGSLAKDKNHVYLGASEVPFADVATYKVSEQFSSDKHHIYCKTGGGILVSRVPSSGFDRLHHLFPSEYAVSGPFVIFDRTCEPVPGADPNTFELQNSRVPDMATDASHVYIGASPLPIDRATFALTTSTQDGEVNGFKDKDHQYVFSTNHGRSDSYQMVK